MQKERERADFAKPNEVTCSFVFCWAGGELQESFDVFKRCKMPLGTGVRCLTCLFPHSPLTFINLLARHKLPLCERVCVCQSVAAKNNISFIN